MMMNIPVMNTVVKAAVIVNTTTETGIMTAHHVVIVKSVARESHVLPVIHYHSQHNPLTQHTLGTCLLK
jgi:hypothetical protein